MQGTIHAHPEFNPEEACIKLNDAMEGLGTDEQAMTDIILAHNWKQRQEIKKRYEEIYDRDLMRQIESELSFSFEQIICALMAEPSEYILDCINEAVTLTLGEGIMKKFQKATYRKGIAADEYTLMGLLFPRPNREIDEIKKAYKKKYKKHLEKRIATSSNLSLDFRRLIIAMIDCKRDETARVDGDTIFKDMMNLIGSKKEETLHVVFHERSFLHLKNLFDGYRDLSGKPIEDMISNSNFTLDLKQSYVALVKLLRSPTTYFVERLHDSMEGAGTDDDTLIQVMVLRSEIDLVDIVRMYEDKYGIALSTDIQGDTSGDFEDILLKMLKIPECVLQKEMDDKRKEEEGENGEAQNENGEDGDEATEKEGEEDEEGDGEGDGETEEEEEPGDEKGEE